MAAHVRLINEFTEDEMYYNLMTLLIGQQPLENWQADSDKFLKN